MLSYEGLQDVVTAAVVVVAVAVVVAAAWLSTSVREQPLVATAVVVFHSGGGSVEGSGSGGGGGGSGSGGDVNVAETPDGGGDGGSGGGGEAAAAPAEEKESEAASSPGEEGMEVKEVVKDSSPARTQEGRQGNAGGGTEAAGAGAGGEEGQCVSPGPEAPPSDTPCPSPQEEVPEMEVRRRRRLQHFVSMGGAAGSTTEDVVGPAAVVKGEGEGGREGDRDRLAAPVTTDTQTPISDTKQGKEDDEEKEKEKEKKEEEEEEEVKESEEGREETRPPGSIKIRLKFLDETQKQVFAQLTEKVGSFKRQHFSIELDAQRIIRLIFNGQLLSQDSSTLAHYGLFDNCVLHCHVSQPQLLPRASGRSGEAAAQEEEDAYVSRLLAPLLYIVMVLMWYLRYEYGHLFNTMSTIILLFLTALLLISTYLLYITHHVPEGAAATHIPVTARTITHTSAAARSASS